VLAYDSYEWPPARHGWPISFFVVTIVFILYLISGLPERRHRHQGENPEHPSRTLQAVPESR